MTSQELTLHRYAELLSSCTRARLTGTRGVDEIYDLQVMDCMVSLKFLPESGSIIDVGCGGGLPGIVWAVYRPDLSITLIDSVNKKCEAVQDIIDTLGIPNAKIFCARSEEFAMSNREKFSLAGARAIASAGVTAELLSPLVKVGGKILTFKGEKIHEEISDVSNQWHRLGLSKPALTFYGGECSSKCVVTWKKVKACPGEFPRRNGLAGIRKFWE